MEHAPHRVRPQLAGPASIRRSGEAPTALAPCPGALPESSRCWRVSLAPWSARVALASGPATDAVLRRGAARCSRCLWCNGYLPVRVRMDVLRNQPRVRAFAVSRGRARSRVPAVSRLPQGAGSFGGAASVVVLGGTRAFGGSSSILHRRAGAHRGGPAVCATEHALPRIHCRNGVLVPYRSCAGRVDHRADVRGLGPPGGILGCRLAHRAHARPLRWRAVPCAHAAASRPFHDDRPARCVTRARTRLPAPGRCALRCRDCCACGWLDRLRSAAWRVR